jgi:hypothetical protein
MIYYFEILEILQENKHRVLSGTEIQAIFFKRYKKGSIIGINKSLKQLRKRKDIKFEPGKPTNFYRFVAK